VPRSCFSASFIAPIRVSIMSCRSLLTDAIPSSAQTTALYCFGLFSNAIIYVNKLSSKAKMAENDEKLVIITSDIGHNV